MRKNILRDKNFLLYFMGMFVTSIGNIFYSFAVSWYILKITSSASQAGFYLAFSGVLSLVLSNFGAALVDRMDKVKIMYMTDYVRGVAIIIAGLVIFNTESIQVILATLYAAAFVNSVFGSLFGPASSALVKYMVAEENLQQANSYLQIKNSVQSILGMALAGFIYTWFGPAWIFILNGITFIMSGFTEMFIRVETQEEIETKTTFKQILIDIKDGWAYVYSKKTIFRLMLIAVFLNFPFALMFGIGLPYLFNQTLNVAPSYLSWVEVVMSVSMIFMMVYLSRLEMNEKYYVNLRKYMILTTVFYLLSVAVVYTMDSSVLPFNISYGLFLFAMALMAVASAGLNVPMQTFFVKAFDKEMFARAMVAIGIMSSVSYPLASVMGGLIIDNLGLSYLIGLSVSIYIFCLSWFLVDKKIKEI